MSTSVPTMHGRGPADGGRLYLLVVDGDASWMHPLAADGTVVIGRVSGCDVQLTDTAASRQHARLEISGSRATVVDLGSQNGTMVNNQRITRRELVGGDVLTIGTAVLVFHGPAAARATITMVSWAELRNQLSRELDRVIHYGRELAVVQLDTGTSERAAVESVLRDHLRKLDVAAWEGEGQLGLLLPETEPEVLDGLLDQLLAALPSARAGFATAPRDGCDVDALLGGARAAASAAEPGARASAAGAMRTLDLGERSVIIADPAMARVYGLVERLAVAELPVLVYGETGTGKELVAAALHHLSPRADRPWVALNCAALPENLVESELFGHERGAFSGAVSAKPGIFELARGGTVFLDEVGELSLAVQAKLLRVLETKRVQRVGDVKEQLVDLRLVSATNRDLKEEVKQGRFRQDLYFRLSGAAVWLPPLRDRQREIPILAHRFVAEACAAAKREPLALAPGAIQRLATYAWPGNVRELKNLCDYLAATVTERRVEDWHLDDVLGQGDGGAAPAPTPAEPPRAEPAAPAGPRFRPLSEEIEELERARIGEALRATGGNQTRAARAISMPLRTFLTKMKRYGITAT